MSLVSGLLSTLVVRTGAETDVRFPIAGTPPLTAEMVQASTSFFQWLLDASLTVEQRQQFRDSIAQSWLAHKQDEIQATVNVIQFANQLDRKSAQEREVYRQVLQAKLLAQIRAQSGSMMAHWVLNIYDSAHQAIAPGRPPLTQQVVDAYAEVVNFMLREALGKTFYAADRSFKDALTKNVIARYPQISTEEQAAMARIPLAWALLQAKWPTIPANEQEKLRAQWRTSLQPIISNADTVSNECFKAICFPRSADKQRSSKELGEFTQPELYDQNHKYYSEPQSFLSMSDNVNAARTDEPKKSEPKKVFRREPKLSPFSILLVERDYTN